jgi:hypothetical protein
MAVESPSDQKVVVKEMSWDPITRIVGSLGIHTEIDFTNQQVLKCYSTSMLFRGFDYFVQSLIATLIMVIPILVIVVPAYIIFFVFMFSQMPKQGQNAPPPDPSAAWAARAMGVSPGWAAWAGTRSKSPSLVNHLADAHGIRLNPLAQRPHSLHDFLVRQFSPRFFNRNQHCCRNTVPRDRDLLAPGGDLHVHRLRV